MAISEKLQTWLEEKLERRENKSGPVEIFVEELEQWAEDYCDIVYGDEMDKLSHKQTIYNLMDKFLENRGK